MTAHSLGQEDPLEKEMATPSSILAWEIPWTEEPGGLQSAGLQSQIWLNMDINSNQIKHFNYVLVRKILGDNFEGQFRKFKLYTRN